MENPVHEYIEVGHNWFIQRRADGSVSMVQKAEARLKSKTIAKFLVTEAVWVKLVAVVSLRGICDETLESAEALHATEGASGIHADPERIVQESLVGEDAVETELIQNSAVGEAEIKAALIEDEDPEIVVIELPTDEDEDEDDE